MSDDLARLHIFHGHFLQLAVSGVVRGHESLARIEAILWLRSSVLQALVLLDAGGSATVRNLELGDGLVAVVESVGQLRL